MGKSTNNLPAKPKAAVKFAGVTATLHAVVDNKMGYTVRITGLNMMAAEYAASHLPSYQARVYGSYRDKTTNTVVAVSSPDATKRPSQTDFNQAVEEFLGRVGISYSWA